MPRVAEVDVERTPPEVREVFRRQMEEYGTYLNPSRVYAHVPSIMLAAQNLGSAILGEPHVEAGILPLVNVRVAQINGCPF